VLVNKNLGLKMVLVFYFKALGSQTNIHQTGIGLKKGQN